jgi:monoamine oxidase
LARHAFRVLLATDLGVPTARQSLLAMLAQVAGGGLEAYWTSSEAFRCRGGNARLVEALAASVGAERIRLGVAVTHVEAERDHVRIETADGTLVADRAVIAVPAAVLARMGIAAAPQMGTAVKYLARVERRFWRDTGLAPQAFSDGHVSQVWEASAGQGGERVVLCAYSGADAAKSLRQQRGEALRELVGAELDALLPGYAAAFASGSFHDWPGEEWTRGGTSFPAPGEVTTRVRALREAGGALAHAGEHTSTRAPGTMEGALESGLRTARAILGPA